MLPSLEQYYAINQAIGLEIYLQKNGSVTIAGCQVLIKDKRLSFEKKAAEITTVEAIAKTFNHKLPVSLNISGKGVLHKRLEKVEEINQDNFSSVLPNARIDEFYVQHFVSGEYSFVTVIRKTDADKWIAIVKEQGFAVFMLSLNAFPVQHVLQQLNTYGNEIVFNGNKITLDENASWLAYQYDESFTAPFVLKIENEAVDQRLLLSYAAVFQLLMSTRLDPIQAHVPELEGALNDNISTRKLKMSGFMILSIFFVLLLINFVAFSALNSSNERLTKQVSRSAQNTSDFQGINDRIKEKEALLKELGWDGGLNKSLMIDQISSLLPGDVRLREITVDPPDPSYSRSERTLKFFSSRINVQGLSAQIIPVNEWIARLKTLKWIKNVQLEKYKPDNELNTGRFSIIIDY